MRTKQIKIFLIVILILGFGLFYYQNSYAQSCQENLKVYVFGLPKSQKKITCLQQEGFSIGYSEQFKNPLWVSYRVAPKRKYNDYNRYRYFSTDKRTRSQVGYHDYSGSGYTRGHMAPASTIYYGFGNQAMETTFLMSNIVPQKYSINGGVWATLEEIERRFARALKNELLVISGPVFDEKKETLDHCSRKTRNCTNTEIEIPDFYYKIIFYRSKQAKQYRAISFLVARESQEKDLRKLLTSIDTIEEMTQIDFFPLLSKTEKNNYQISEQNLEHNIQYNSFAEFTSLQ